MVTEMADDERLEAMMKNDTPADAWVAANDAVDQAALAIELRDGLVLGTGQRHQILTAMLRAITRVTRGLSGGRIAELERENERLTEALTKYASSLNWSDGDDEGVRR